MSENRIPKLRKHPRKNKPAQAYARFNGTRIYFGLWGTPEATAAYERYLCEWLARGRCAPVHPAEISVAELCDMYTRHVEANFSNIPATLEKIALALTPLLEIYARLECTQFGPVCLRASRVSPQSLLSQR